MPDAPALKIVKKSIPAPSENAKNGISTRSPSPRNLRISSSRLPMIMPIAIGISTARNAVNGMDAKPDRPNAIMVKNGPSLSESTDIAPTSDSSPYSAVSDTYSPPLELVIAAISANGVRPSSTPPGTNIATPRPIATPIAYLPPVRIMPFFSATGAMLKFICAPMQNRNMPISGSAPFLNNAVVNPPILKNSGANVLIRAPSNRGTTIIPPGTFSMLFLIGSCITFPPRFFANRHIPALTYVIICRPYPSRSPDCVHGHGRRRRSVGLHSRSFHRI